MYLASKTEMYDFFSWSLGTNNTNNLKKIKKCVGFLHIFGANSAYILQYSIIYSFTSLNSELIIRVDCILGVFGVVFSVISKVRCSFDCHFPLMTFH